MEKKNEGRKEKNFIEKEKKEKKKKRAIFFQRTMKRLRLVG